MSFFGYLLKTAIGYRPSAILKILPYSSSLLLFFLEKSEEPSVVEVEAEVSVPGFDGVEVGN